MRSAVIVVTLILTNVPLAAQEVPALAPGRRIRVSVAGTDPRLYIGLYQGLRDSSLVLQPDGPPLSIPLNLVRDLEVSAGRKLSVVGGVVGFLLGGAVGFFTVGCLANRDDYGVVCAGQDDTKFYLGGLAGGAVGGVLGALLFRRERWDAVDIRSVAPRPR